MHSVNVYETSYKTCTLCAIYSIIYSQDPEVKIEKKAKKHARLITDLLICQSLSQCLLLQLGMQQAELLAPYQLPATAALKSVLYILSIYGGMNL